MPSKVQLIGGVFQDAEGNALVDGYLTLQLSQDGSVTGVGQIASGITVRINLNALGSVDTSTPQDVWGNDQIIPVNSFYIVRGFAADGQPAWGPNNQQVIGNGGTFDVGTWVPNQLISWVPPLQALELETNGTPNAIQTLLNLIAGSNVTLTADGAGGVTVAASAPVGITLETNGTPNSSQSLLNLVGSGGTSVSESGGTVTINSSGSGPAASLVMNNPTLIAAAVNFSSQVLSVNMSTAGTDDWACITRTLSGADVNYNSSNGDWRYKRSKGGLLIPPHGFLWNGYSTLLASGLSAGPINMSANAGDDASASFADAFSSYPLTNVNALAILQQNSTSIVPTGYGFTIIVPLRGNVARTITLYSGVACQFNKSATVTITASLSNGAVANVSKTITSTDTGSGALCSVYSTVINVTPGAPDSFLTITHLLTSTTGIVGQNGDAVAFQGITVA